MAITSVNNQGKKRRYGNTQFRYTLLYVCITLVVLVFLNIYCSQTSQRLFYQSKEALMTEKCQLAAADIANLEVLNTSNVAEAVSHMEGLRITRLLITDHAGVVLYDSDMTDPKLGSYVLLPEVVQAMGGRAGQDVFTWEYHDGLMYSRVAIPVLSYGTIVGCVYMMELDAEQGVVLQNLQQNIFTITFALALVIILFSMFFVTGFSRRLKRVLTSMRIIRGGDYSHRVAMGGRDELTALGDEFDQLTERLELSESRRSQFVSDASHELKTPLASIKLLTDSILQNDMDQASIREFVSDIGNEADRLNRLTQKLLALTRIDHQDTLMPEVSKIQPTVDRAIRMLTGVAEQQNVTIVPNFEADPSVMIPEDDLYQIVFNLVENGIKYNVSGGTLRIRVCQEGKNAVLKVADTGIGIPRYALPHIFERFYRVDKARSRSTGGSGLGLAIVYSKVEQHGGTITAKSTMKKGSVFTVTFPVCNTKEAVQ